MRTTTWIAIVVLLVGAVSAIYYSLRRNNDWVVGGLYALPDEDGRYGVAKILVLDRHAVHIRVYKEKFPSPPQEVNEHNLTLGSIHDTDGFGIGHLPLSRASFRGSKPIFLRQSTVSEAELDGYREWKDANGGVWK